MMSPRLGEILWVLEYLYEIESDMSRFHRVDDIYSMDSVRFFRLANRLAYYNGAVAKKVTADLQELEASPSMSWVQPRMVSPSPTADVVLPAEFQGRTDINVVPSSPQALALSPLGDLFSFGTG